MPRLQVPARMDKAHAVEVLRHLVELERDHMLGFDAAIHRLHDREARARIADFRAEHAAALGDLEDAMKALMVPPPELATLGGLHEEARVAAASLVGDEAVVGVIADVERESIDAYAAAAADDALGDSLRQKLENKLDGERAHGTWLARWLGRHG